MPVVMSALNQVCVADHSPVLKDSNHRQRVVTKELTRPADLWAAVDLIVGEYLAQGYLPQQNVLESKLKMFDSLGFYRMFGAYEDNRLVAVLGLNDADVLPIDSVYSGEVDHLRAGGRQVGEIGKFASRGTSRFTVIGLMITVAQVANEYLDYIVLTVNPKHAGFYTKIANFHCFTQSPRPLPSVCNAPAIGLYAKPEQVLSCTRARKTMFV